MKWRKVMAFSLAASMIAGQAVSAAPAAEAASESALQTQADSKSTPMPATPTRGQKQLSQIRPQK